MAKETVRYSDSIVQKVNELVEEGQFDSKSEFYRFSAELLLNSLREDYKPEMIDYDSIAETIRQETEQSPTDHADGSIFYQSAITVRRHARNGNITAAEEHIDSHYAPERGEYLLLESLLDYYQDQSSTE